MNGILGMSKLLAGAQLSEKNKTYLNAIEESATGLLAIINDILDLSKVESGNLEIENIETDIIHACKKAINAMEFFGH